MRSISLAILVLIAADASFAAAESAPPAGSPVAVVDRECLARHARRDRAELDRARVPARTTATAPVVRPGVGALRIAIDPVSGARSFEIVPNAAAPAASLDRSSEGLTVVRHPDGSESVELGERFMEYAVVQIEPDGTKQLGCVSSASEAQKIATAPVSSAAKPAAPRRATSRRNK